MICIITYFFDVSDLYFAIFAFAFELTNIVLKVWSYFKNKNNQNKAIEDNSESIEDI